MLENLFCFQKRLDGSYQYHLFPKLNLQLIENEALMKKADRNVYIKQIISSLEQNQEDQLQFFSPDDFHRQKKGMGIKFQLTKFNYESHYELQIVYITWIYMWCATFKDQDDREQQFRINQMIQVLIKMKDPILTMNSHQQAKLLDDLLNQIIKTTFNYSKQKLSEMIYKKFLKIFQDIITNDSVDERVKHWIRAEQ